MDALNHFFNIRQKNFHDVKLESFWVLTRFCCWLCHALHSSSADPSHRGMWQAPTPEGGEGAESSPLVLNVA